MAYWNVFFMDSFDALGTDVSSKWSAQYLGWPTIVVGGGRDGVGNCMRLIANGASYVTKSFPAYYTNIGIGFAFKCHETTEWNGLRFYYGAYVAPQCCLTFNTDGSISLWRGYSVTGTEVAHSNPNKIVSGQWNYITVNLTISNAGSIVVYVNGVEALNQGSIDTTFNAATGAGVIRIYGTTSSGTDYRDIDDFYLADSSSGDPITDCEIQVLRPIADGPTVDWTAAPAVADYLNVDDTTHDSDTTYVSAASAPLDELFQVEQISYVAGMVIYAAGNNYVVKDSVGASTTVSSLLDSDVTLNVATAEGVPASYVNLQTVYNTDPNSTTRWSDMVNPTTIFNACYWGLRRAT